MQCTKIWEAARATSAATTFFDEISIGNTGRKFQDGAFGANCPVKQLWREASAIWSSNPLEDQLGCVLSIGTGAVSPKVFNSNLLNIAAALKDIALNADRVAKDFADDHVELVNDGRYTRLNVVHGLENVGLEDASRGGEIAAFTAAYMKDRSVQAMIGRCVANANEPCAWMPFTSQRWLTYFQ